MSAVLKIKGPDGNIYKFPFAKGDKGDKGDTGETGPQGPQGPKGDIGPQGPIGTISGLHVTVTSLNPGTEPTISHIVNGEETTLSFGIPKGEKGDTGEKGVSGVYVGEGTPDGFNVFINPDGTDDPNYAYSKAESDAKYLTSVSVKDTLDNPLVPNTLYVLGEQTEVTLNFPTTANIGEMIGVIFYNGTTPATLSITNALPHYYLGTAGSRVEINAI